MSNSYKNAINKAFGRGVKVGYAKGKKIKKYRIIKKNRRK